jgi:hypothetical protein
MWRLRELPDRDHTTSFRHVLSPTVSCTARASEGVA